MPINTDIDADADEHSGGAPYFLVRQVDEILETSGRAEACFGHELPSDNHDVVDGVFARWLWDGRRLVVRNDRYGCYPLFWFRLQDGGVCVSPSIEVLIEQGAPRDLDTESLAVFFRLGYFVGDDTPFRAIKSVPPHAVFEWENNRLQCRGRYPATPVVVHHSRDEAIDTYIDLFSRSMAKRTPGTGRCVVPLSGGRDSRHILLELHRTGRPPDVCVSALDHPPDPNEDPAIAAQLCKALQLDCTIVPQQLPVFSAEWQKNRETNFCTPMHSWYLALSTFVNGRFDYAYDGIGGDVLSQSKSLNPDMDAVFRSSDVRAICSALISRQKTSASVTLSLLKGELAAARDEGLAITRLATEVEKHLDHPNPVGSFMFWNRTRRSIALAPYNMIRGISCVYAPFLDHELFDYLSSLPVSLLMDHKFHDQTIARAYPSFSDIPYARNSAPMASNNAQQARFLAQAAGIFALKRPSRIMKNMVPRARMLASVCSFGRVNPWVPKSIIYIDQIESMLRR
ncbi:hypothetical protein [Oleiagrimonas sp. C23AA]|uniref:hypothetical protein n=1 Tax=Oleiagrimonas sp. C23AA TaxID=2719047 RepID=UPI00141F31C3|nr:hypothetical protein [Oleiagrimonas sp. C23AA]NII11153.1 hypothetical protein [Oleiagrimonas sp. C23AA]